jgi:hypothetical protein
MILFGFFDDRIVCILGVEVQCTSNFVVCSWFFWRRAGSLKFLFIIRCPSWRSLSCSFTFWSTRRYTHVGHVHYHFPLARHSHFLCGSFIYGFLPRFNRVLSMATSFLSCHPAFFGTLTRIFGENVGRSFLIIDVHPLICVALTRCG